MKKYEFESNDTTIKFGSKEEVLNAVNDYFNLSGCDRHLTMGAAQEHLNNVNSRTGTALYIRVYE